MPELSHLTFDRPGPGAGSPVSLPESPPSPWRVLWTRSHCEKPVRDRLAARGFDLFLPWADAWSRRGGSRRVSGVPLFPGYVFLRHPLDKASYVEVMKTRGIVRILGERWDRPAVVPDSEIDSIRTVLQTGTPILPHPFLREGRRARIVHGPLKGVEGILVKARPEKGLLVLSVQLLQRSVAVEVDCTWVVPG